MKPFEQQTYYELLEIPVTATPEEIRSAYERALEFYSPDSVAVYALVDSGQLDALRERLTEAVEFLSDAELRAEYDRSIGLTPSAANTVVPPVPPLVEEAPEAQKKPEEAQKTPEEAPAAEQPAEAAPEARTEKKPAPSAEPPPATAPEASTQPEPSPAEPAATSVAPSSPAPEPFGGLAVTYVPRSFNTSAFFTSFALTARPLPPAPQVVPEASGEGEDLPEVPADEVTAVPGTPPPEPTPEASPSTKATPPPLPPRATRSASAAPATPAPAQESPAEPARPAAEPVEAPKPASPAPTAARPPSETGLAQVSRPREPARPRPVEIPPNAEFNGELLRSVRESRGFTLHQLADRTRISLRHLENVEADRYEALPTQVYLRGILMSMARELGLDPLRVSRSYLELASKYTKR